MKKKKSRAGHNLHDHITQDQQAFMAQKDTPGGKRTLKAYLWKVCGEEYDAQH